jgi:hypothetical protein
MWNADDEFLLLAKQGNHGGIAPTYNEFLLLAKQGNHGGIAPT